MSDAHDKSVAIVERKEPAQGMSPVVAAIMQHNLSPETVREMLAMQREWEANEAKKAYDVAFVQLKADLPKILAHDKTVDFNTTHYTHTSLAAVVGAVVPHLVTHGFSHKWIPGRLANGDVEITCRLTHQAGHYEDATLSGPPDAKGGKNGAQAVMSTVTMLERYTLLALLGIATADMKEQQAPEEDPSAIDTERNMRAVGRLKKYGKTKEQAEAFLQRPMEEWTTSDVERIGPWAKGEASK